MIMLGYSSVNQVFRSGGVKITPLWDSHVDNASLVIWMNEFISPLPLPVRSILLSSLSVNPRYQAGDGDPEDQGNNNDCAHNIVLEELEEAADADLINEVPDSDNVLTGLLAHALVAEALEAGCAVGQDVHGRHGVAGAVQVASAAPLTRVS